jgi:hypothetical protein
VRFKGQLSEDAGALEPCKPAGLRERAFPICAVREYAKYRDPVCLDRDGNSQSSFEGHDTQSGSDVVATLTAL